MDGQIGVLIQDIDNKSQCKSNAVDIPPVQPGAQEDGKTILPTSSR